MNYFCSSCDEAICKECQQLGPHNTKYHAIISIKEAFNIKHNKISQIINDKLIYRYNKLNIALGMEKLITETESQFSADQRAGQRTDGQRHPGI